MRYFRKLVGEKVYLSPINEEDYETYCQWINQLGTTIPLGNATTNYTLVKEKELLRELSEGQAFAIVRASDDKLLGNCSLFNINQLHQHGTLGLFIGDEEDRGKGYGTEAIQLLLEYGFRLLNLHNIMLQVFSFNGRGIRSYEKAGFKEFGRRHEVFRVNGKFYDEISMEILEKDYHGNLLAGSIEKVVGYDER